MKYFLCFAIVFLIVAGACQQKSGEHHHDSNEEIQGSPNHALYDEVMAVHDEVMPRMDDLYKRKTALKKQLDTSGLSEGEKNEINEKIARIDAASEGMMVWMRQFNPLPDSAGQDKATGYLESELIKVKKVREDILKALESTE